MPVPASDLVFPSALAGLTQPVGVLYPSVSLAQKDLFSVHKKIVFLKTADRAEIQRAASARIPVLLSVHSLQSAFDVFKLAGVSAILVQPDGNRPIIDVGWMGKAKEEEKSVVFSFLHFQQAVQHGHVNTLQEYRKLARLLEKSRIAAGLATFAESPEEQLSPREKESVAHYLGINSFALPWVL